MTKEQGLAILGEPARRAALPLVQASAETGRGSVGVMDQVEPLEWWEYNWTSEESSGRRGFSPYAKAVVFGREGLLCHTAEPDRDLSWRYWAFRRVTQSL